MEISIFFQNKSIDTFSLKQILCIHCKPKYCDDPKPISLVCIYFRSISGEDAAEDSDDDELDSDTEEQEAPSDYVKGELST